MGKWSDALLCSVNDAPAGQTAALWQVFQRIARNTRRRTGGGA